MLHIYVEAGELDKINFVIRNPWTGKTISKLCVTGECECHVTSIFNKCSKFECFYYFKIIGKSTDQALFIAIIWQVNLDNGSAEKQRNCSCQLLAISYFSPLHGGAQAISLAFVKEDVFINIALQFRALFCGNLVLAYFWRSAPKSTHVSTGQLNCFGTGEQSSACKRKQKTLFYQSPGLMTGISPPQWDRNLSTWRVVFFK